MSFEEWCKQYCSVDNFSSMDGHLMARMLLRSLWDNRQERIDRLEKENAELKKQVELLEECVDFYGEVHNYDYEGFIDGDLCDDGMRYWGGKRARETKKKLEELRGEG